MICQAVVNHHDQSSTPHHHPIQTSQSSLERCELFVGVVALVAAISGVMMLWPGGEEPVSTVRTDLVPGYGPQCSQLYNTIEHTWTEEQWSVWEQLRKDLNC